ncbi:hypothetical protein BH23PSE1_BH23PSE1_12980 [soil metagenome]
MAEGREQGLFTAEHGTLTERTDQGAPHEHGTMDIEAQMSTFEGFIKFWVYLFGATFGILIFLALFNS